MRFMILKMVF